MQFRAISQSRHRDPSMNYLHRWLQCWQREGSDAVMKSSGATNEDQSNANKRQGQRDLDASCRCVKRGATLAVAATKVIMRTRAGRKDHRKRFKWPSRNRKESEVLTG